MILLACLAASVAEMAARSCLQSDDTSSASGGFAVGTSAHTRAAHLRLRASLHTDRRATGLRLPALLRRDRWRVPDSSNRLQRLIHLYQQQREAVASLEEANTRLERASLSFATATRRHTRCAGPIHSWSFSGRRDLFSRHRCVGWDCQKREQDLVHLCGLVHDIGKIGLPAWAAREARRAHARGTSTDGGTLRRSGRGFCRKSTTTPKLRELCAIITSG